MKEKTYISKIISIILKYDYKYVLDNLIYIDTTLNKNNIYHKGSIGDIIVSIDNYVILFECNSYKSRELIYKNYHTFHGLNYNMVRKGQTVKDKKAIMISIDNYDILNKNEEVYEVLLKDDKSNEIVNNNYKIYHINLVKIKEVLYSSNIEELSEFYKVFGFLANMKKDIDKKLEKEEYLMDAIKKFGNSILPIQELVQFSYEQKQEIDRRHMIEEIKKDIRNEVKEEIKKEERREGRKRGKIEGIKQNLKKIVTNMLSKNYCDEDIIECTNINRKEFYKIKNNYQNKMSNKEKV